MKKLIIHSTYFAFAFALCIMFLSGCSCSAPKPMSDPLAGFHVSSLGNLDSNKAITDDYKAYIKTLSPEERKNAGPIFFYEDGTGQHAVEIKIGLNGAAWLHILIYDKDNKRINSIKHVIGHYAS